MNLISTTTSPEEVKAAAQRALKVTSAIQPDPKYLITKTERFQNALYFYNNRTKARRSEWTWASLVTQALFPTAAQKELNAKTHRDTKFIWKSLSDAWIQSGIVATVSVKKNFSEKTFTATVPILISTKEGFPRGLLKLLIPCSGDKLYSTSEEFRTLTREADASVDVEKIFPLNKLRPAGSLVAKEVQFLDSSNAKLIIKPIAGYSVAMLQLDFNQRESEFLCNSAWLEIRPLDFYGVIRSWVDGYFGMRARSATFSIPLGRIAKHSDAKSAAPRTSADGLVLDQHGSIYALPSKLNSISQYEDLASTAYTRSDGTFSAFSEEGTLKTPPPSIPVYIDWCNLKFAYTSLDGKLLIQDLDRVQPVNVTHVRKFLERVITHDTTKNFLSFVIRLSDFFRILPEAATFAKSLFADLENVNRKTGNWMFLTETPLQAIYDYGSANADTPGTDGYYCYQFFEAAKKTCKFIQDNPTNAYAKYSVPTITELLGQLIVFTKYAPDYGSVKAQDNTKREVYTKQGEDPNYQLPDVPFVKDKTGLMPHQFKVTNLLRNSPDNAIMPVDAGGGKTSLILFEILKEIKSSVDSLSLVMCPSHLVAQYVKEFTYFVGNSVNIIPVTSHTIRRHGLDKLRKMIENSARNTLVVTDFNAIVLKKLTISYGVAPVTIFPIVEFLRQFPFKYVAVDESHWLKNKSNRNKAAGRLLIEVPKKRLASGTIVADTITDIVQQMALIDPSVFGTLEDFIAEYALEVRGTKVVKWKHGAELLVNRAIKQNVVIAGAKRKEWAAILPKPVEKFHVSSLTENQFRVYQNILMQVQEEILKKAQEDERLARLVRGEIDEEDPEMDLNSLLKPYLARLERFLTAPGLDTLGEKLLSGEDLVSPKVHKIIEICREHLQKNIPGKILIFTNYKLSAEAIYENFPEDLKSQAIYYTAGNKDVDGAEFERNPAKKIMVGVEQSMNTGLNLQFCSRLIRVETVWTPGVLEQGNSRVGRPNVKDRESRPYVYYDWIAANQTIDVTKISYLMAKTISTAKFYEAGNPKYDELEVPTLLKMDLQTVFAQNDFETTLVEYFGKYQSYKQVVEAERDEYREANKDKLFDAQGKIKMAAFTRSADPEGSEVIHDAVYQPGLELDGMTELGLIRYDAFMKLDESDLEEDEAESEGEEGSDESEEEEEEENADPKAALKKAMLMAERAKAIGLPVHTDLGDGHILRVGARWLTIKTKSGERIRQRKLAVFVYTKEIKANVDLRTLVLKNTTSVPIDAPVTLDSGVEKKVKKPKIPKEIEPQEDAVIEMELDFTIVNDFLGVKLVNVENESAVRVAQSMGFKFAPSYYAAQIKRPIQFKNFFEALAEKGFEVDKENSQACYVAWKHFVQNKQSGTNFYGVATDNAIRNFYRLEFKPNPNVKHVNPYPLIQDGLLYVALPKNGQPGSPQAIRKARVPGLNWYQFDSDTELVCFTPRKEKAGHLIERLLEEGIVISNIKELKQKFRKLRVARDKIKSDDDL